MLLYIAVFGSRESEKFVDRLLVFLSSAVCGVSKAFSGCCVGDMAPLSCLRFCFLCSGRQMRAASVLVVTLNKRLRVLLASPV